MAINFPSAPNQGDSHTEGSVTWIYNGSAWDSLYQPTAKSQVGLGNVDNTSDEDKPVSTAQQAALDALTKDDVGLDNVDNTSDINKPVSTAQQAAIDAAGGGSSFDQDLNTTDSPTFVTVNATDLDATGTVTAGEVTTNQINSPNSFISFRPSDFERLQITTNDIRPNSFGDYDLGRATNTFNNCYLHGTLSTADIDATGTVTAGDVEVTNDITIPLYKRLNFGSATYSITKGATYLQVQSWSQPVKFFGSAGEVLSVGTDTGVVEVMGDLDTTGTVTAGGFVGTPQTLTDAATITYDLASGHNAKVTLTDDRTLALPINLAEGASGVLTITQDGTGGRALALASGWFVSAGALAEITALAANEQAQITWYAYASNKVNATILPLQ